MSREKKSQVDDITKLRRILDNSSDPSLKYLISQQDYALESVRQRLSGEFYKIQPMTKGFFTASTSMEPRVSIRAKTPLKPYFTLPQLKPEPTLPLPEFELVSQSTPEPLPLPEVHFDDEELFEVEKIEESVPEFLEVKSKEIEQEPQPFAVSVPPVEPVQSELNLPEWQPVEEENEFEEIQAPATTMQTEAPEFERIDISTEHDQQIETPVEFTPVTQTETLIQKPSKKQERAEKKALRKKEKEEKKRWKLEQKRIKKESKEKQQTIKEFEEVSQPIHQDDEAPTQESSLEKNEPAFRPIDYNNFKGIKSINEKTAELLYKNGYFSVENIKEASIDDLVQIRGIKRKLAKQIKKEIEQQDSKSETSEFIPVKQKITKKKNIKKHKESAEWESSVPSEEKVKSSKPKIICTYKEYTLYRQELHKPNGPKKTIYSFLKGKSTKADPAPLPDGYRIAINKKTGVPYLKKK
jgi:hypothetical protein